MSVYVALLRGINVGGRNTLPMRDLRSILTQLGCTEVSSYIQSGNVVFRSRRTRGTLSRQVSAAILQRFGFQPFVLVMPGAKLLSIATANPYADEAQDPKTVHVLFLAETPNDPDFDRIHELQSPTERFALGDSAFYLYAPDGIGRSRLAGALEKLLGVPTTGRNWKTVRRLVAMVAEIG